MRRASYGYTYKNGNLIIEDDEARKLKILFKAYLELSALQKAGDRAGMNCSHPTIKGRLTNPVYLGDQNHPPIIDKDIFDVVQKKLRKRKRKINAKEQPIEYKVPEFRLIPSTETKDNPFEEAEALYSRIEEIHAKN